GAQVLVARTAKQDRAGDELVLGAANPIAKTACTDVRERVGRVPLRHGRFVQPRVTSVVDDGEAAAFEEGDHRDDRLSVAASTGTAKHSSAIPAVRDSASNACSAKALSGATLAIANALPLG